MSYALGSISPLRVTSYTGFDLPDDVQAVRLLNDGTTTHNAVLQSSGPALPEATLRGVTTDSSVVSALRGYRLSHASVSLTDPEGTRSVVVVSLAVQQDKVAGLFDYTIVLAELTAPA